MKTILTRRCWKCKRHLPLDAFALNIKRNNGRQTTCRTCKSAWDKIYYQEHKAKFLVYNADKRRELRAWVDDYKKQHPCACGEADSVCLVFHHTDKKDECIARAINRCWSLKRLIQEISGCIVMCANCHMKLHAKLRECS